MKQTRSITKQGSSRRSTSGGENESTENPLYEAFLEELADIHNGEQQLTKALPKMAKAAQSEELRAALESHLEETEAQIERIEQAAKSLGESVKRKKCRGMEGLIEEGEEMMKEFKDDPASDAVLIAAAQKVEHYEIASYGTLIAWAEQMDHADVVEFLQSNLDEEKAANEKLTGIAEDLANVQAQSGVGNY